MTSDWKSLPEHLWITILKQLDAKTLLIASETCTLFRDLLTNTILTDKLKLRIDFIFNDHLQEVLECSNRKYRSLVLRGFSQYVPNSSEDFQTIIDILKL